MEQQQLGGLALIAAGLFVAASAASAALRRRRTDVRMREALWSRLLATFATAGLAIGFVSMGISTYGPPAPQPTWLPLVSVCAFATAVIGYVVTIIPAAWRGWMRLSG